MIEDVANINANTSANSMGEEDSRNIEAGAVINAINDHFIEGDSIAGNKKTYEDCSECFSQIKHFKVQSKEDQFRSRTFKIERITISIFSFCIGLVTQLNGPALGVLKHHYITKRICELLIGNSRILIYNLLNQLLYYTI